MNLVHGSQTFVHVNDLGAKFMNFGSQGSWTIQSQL